MATALKSIIYMVQEIRWLSTDINYADTSETDIPE